MTKIFYTGIGSRETPEDIVPSAWQAFLDYRMNGVQLSAMEMQV